MSSEQMLAHPRGRVLRGVAAGGLRNAVIDADLTLLRPSAFEGPSPVASLEELEAIERKAREDAARVGYEDGFAAGQRDAAAQADAQAHADHQRFEQALAALDTAAAALRAQQDVTVADVEQQIITLAMSVAEAVVGHEIAIAKAPARGALVRALALAPRGIDAVARVNPADAETLDDLPVPADRSVTVAPDPSVEPGGCVLEVGACRIDAQVGPALARVREALQA
jgi:flagellar assembly protein FliH